MFQFPTFAPFGNISSRYWVAPFRNLRIKSYLLIPAAFRSLSRLSSPLRAKASPIRPYFTSFSPKKLTTRWWEFLNCLFNFPLRHRTFSTPSVILTSISNNWLTRRTDKYSFVFVIFWLIFDWFSWTLLYLIIKLFNNCGECRSRTDDLLRARQTL